MIAGLYTMVHISSYAWTDRFCDRPSLRVLPKANRIEGSDASWTIADKDYSLL